MEGRAFAQAKPSPAKLQRIAIMSLCFDSLLKNGMPQADASRALDVMDLPQMIADRYGVHNIEMQHAHFLSTDADYFKMFRERVAKAKSQLTQINLEFGQSNVSAGGTGSTRAQAVDLSRIWIDHAVALGCPRVMVNQGTLAEGETRTGAIAALKSIAAYGQARKVQITMENRDTGVLVAPPLMPVPPASAAAPAAGAAAAGRQGGGGGGRGGGAPAVPATWQVVADVIKAAGIFANPDIGNFPNEQERVAGLKVLYTMTAGSSHCHYHPSYFANAIKISKDVGYKGLYAIKATAANNPDPHAATKMILDELVKLL